MSNFIRVPTGSVELAVESFGAGPPLIFAHGLTGSRRGAKRQFAALAPQHRIVVYDQRGHGESTPVYDPAGYAIDDMAADLGAVMDALGIERAIVGGESMGAATTLHFALHHPARVERLLLTAPAFGDKPNSEIKRFLDLAEAIETYGMERFLIAAESTWRTDLHWSPDAVAYAGSMFRAHDERSLVAAIRGVIGWTPLPNLEPLRSVTAPTCLITWPDDPLHPAELTQRMAVALPCARVIDYPPLPAIFEAPESVGELFGGFLDEFVR
ncbi:MAG: alpha/beta hydrolase [Caldilinea sp.]|uniref:alpha/beta fold hydrolase n=1 Tax=Caldilinea sp. TaxID=2293560 RepID=UPI002BAFC3C1|nr:alpha/beta fold hydrolase [Anaerolineales bacterium]HQY92585.1 alpha/beta hydrolase [Caldilinea sp.]HRA66425.1 alpha/beta hydrolase [Caldilinea sp.]